VTETTNIYFLGKVRKVPVRIYCNGKWIANSTEYDKHYHIVKRGEDEYGLRDDGTRYLVTYDDELRLRE